MKFKRSDKMFNQLFIDTMDQINTIAKSMNYTNGISWARYAFDHKLINSYDFNEFENCHILRNLMAHGHLRDINISEETMKNVNIFHKTILNRQLTAAKSAILDAARYKSTVPLTVD